MKTLFIAFDAEEAVQGAGFAQTWTRDFDILQLSGDPQLNLGAGIVISWNLPSLPPADYFANAIFNVAENYDRIVSVSSMRGKDGLPRLAGLLDWPMITDVVEVLDEVTFVRPILAGSVLTKVRLKYEKCILTFRPAAFPSATFAGESKLDSNRPIWNGATTRLSQSKRDGGRPDLSSAKVVVSGGRPLKDAETFEKIIGGLADAMNGAVGATRAAVDSGIAPNELQVGQTGKIVAPDLYIAAGISGSTQHMAGIKDSKIIVAINIDGDAPIFESADIGLVGDLFDILPELTTRVKK